LVEKSLACAAQTDYCSSKASAKEDAGEGKHIGYAEESDGDRRQPRFETSRRHENPADISKKGRRLK
jgi:hypothetical protein